MAEFHPREAALGRYLIERGILSIAQAQAFLEQGQRQNKALMTVLCEQNILTPDAAKSLFHDAQNQVNPLPAAQASKNLEGSQSPLFVSAGAPLDDLVVTLKDDVSSATGSDPSITPFDAGSPALQSHVESDLESCFDGPRYEFLEGDSNDSFLALDVALDKSVLMKLGPEADDAKPFIREALILAGLDHPCIPRVLDIGERAGRVFFTLDQSPQTPLSELNELSDLSLEARLRRVLDLCDAIHHAGQKGLVHGRLDSAALALGDYGRFLITGWKDAWVLRDSPLRHKVSVKPRPFEASIGTAPELKSGENPSLTADVWSLGRILEILVFERVLDTLPPALLAIHRKATAPSPSQRYSSAGELANELRSFLDDERVNAFEEGPIRSLRRFAQRHPIPNAVFLLSIIVVLTAAALTLSDWLLASREEKKALQAARQSGEIKAAAKVEVDKALNKLGDFLAWQKFSKQLEQTRSLILTARPDSEILAAFQRAEEQVKNARFQAKTLRAARQALSIQRGDWAILRAKKLRSKLALDDYQRVLKNDPGNQDALFGALRALRPSLVNPRDAAKARASLSKTPSAFKEIIDQEARFYQFERAIRRARENRSLMRQGMAYVNSRPPILAAREEALSFAKNSRSLFAENNKDALNFNNERARNGLLLRADHSSLELGPPRATTQKQRDEVLQLYQRYFSEFARNPRNSDLSFGAFELHNEKVALLQTWRWENAYFFDRLVSEKSSIQNPSIFFLLIECLQILNQQGGSKALLDELKRLEPKSYKDEQERVFWLRTRLMRARCLVALGLPTQLPSTVQDWPISLHSEWAVLRAYGLFLESLPDEGNRCISMAMKTMRQSNSELIREDLARLMADPRVVDQKLKQLMKSMIPTWSINESKSTSKMRASYCLLSLQLGQRDIRKDLAGLTQSISKGRLRDHDTIQLYRMANALEWSTYQPKNPYGHKLALEVWALFNDHAHSEENNYDCQKIIVDRLKKRGKLKAAEQFASFDAVAELWQRRVWVNRQLHNWTKRVAARRDKK